MWTVFKLLQVTLHVANGHSFVNAMLFLVLHRGLRQAAADACCNSMSAVGRWLTAGWSPEPYALDAVMPGASPEPVLAAPPPPPPTSLPAYTIRHTSMRVSNETWLLLTPLHSMGKQRSVSRRTEWPQKKVKLPFLSFRSVATTFEWSRTLETHYGHLMRPLLNWVFLRVWFLSSFVISTLVDCTGIVQRSSESFGNDSMTHR